MWGAGVAKPVHSEKTQDPDPRPETVTVPSASADDENRDDSPARKSSLCARDPEARDDRDDRPGLGRVPGHAEPGQ